MSARRARTGALLATAVALTLTGCASASAPSAGAAGAEKAATVRLVAFPTMTAVTGVLAPRPAAVRALPLAGRTIVLDPGHNGLNAKYPARANALVPAGGYSKPCNTTGTATDAGYPEHAFSWALATRTAALLRAQGARVILTRANDSSFGPCVNIRAAIANRARATLTISLHADGARSGAFGFHVIEPALAPDHGNSAILTASHRLALDVRAGFRSATGESYANYVAHQGLDRRNDLAGLNLARVPAVFIETGNMRNASDARKLGSTAFQQRAAQGLTSAVLAYAAGR